MGDLRNCNQVMKLKKERNQNGIKSNRFNNYVIHSGLNFPTKREVVVRLSKK